MPCQVGRVTPSTLRSTASEDGCTPLELTGQPQLQRFAQFVKPRQHPAFVLERDDLLLEPLEKHLRGAAGKLVPVDGAR